MMQHLGKKRGEEGFTLIELLVVIVILGILAAVVVFAVGGICNKGQQKACDTDKKTIQTAEEAYFAQHSTYTDTGGLTGAKLLADTPTLHSVTGDVNGYTITNLGACA